MDNEEIEQMYGWQRKPALAKNPTVEVLKEKNDHFTQDVAEECLRQMRLIIASSNPYKKLEEN
jgi:hypothetical protein